MIRRRSRTGTRTTPARANATPRPRCGGWRAGGPDGGTMSEAILTEPPVTVTAFDAFLDAQQDDSLWELVAGRIVAMTNPTEVHEQIAGNIGAPLKLAMDPKGCHVYQCGIGFHRS